MVKAIVIKDVDGKLIAVAQVQELTSQEFLTLDKEAKENREKDLAAKAEQDALLSTILKEIRENIDKIQKQIKYDHGEIDSLEEK